MKVQSKISLKKGVKFLPSKTDHLERILGQVMKEQEDEKNVPFKYNGSVIRKDDITEMDGENGPSLRSRYKKHLNKY